MGLVLARIKDALMRQVGGRWLYRLLADEGVGPIRSSVPM